ncbi:tonB-dependent Receptor Plug domain protein [Lysobacter antibioticus]|uniref:TonB-dependent receptor domain-containing protein n=1 Tax=Lysobacter antibioticus TaxID=84531 RepID=UPI000717454B|nr:TonB-dependent receptor [Lysobacter antibioticus]ALN62308.1 tonB-dependent Receptor Plug domain protein [Lysobacter antibioticus]
MAVRNSQGLQRSRLTAALVSAMLVSVAGTGYAQDAAPADATATAATDIDAVTVTGSRIKRIGFVTPSPVVGISAEEIRSTGAVTIADLMTTLPQLSATYTLGNSTRAIGTAGLGLLDLRGMGSARTLVLVNGRRHVGGTSGSTAVDVNTIPVELIERVEVITGGASAVYGADAVAGVVNFIMKKKFDGYEIRAQTGDASEGDFSRSFISATGGNEFAGGRGNIVYSAEYSKQDRFGRGDRKIGREFNINMPNPNFDPSKPPSQTNPQRVFMGPGGNSSLSYGGTFNLGGKRYLFNDDGSFRPNRYDGPREGANNCVDCDFADLNGVADLQPGFDRYSVNTMLNFEINENHKFFFEGKYTKTESDFLGQPPFDQPFRIRRDNALISPQLGALMDANGLASPASQLQISRFNVDAGRRGEQVDRKTQRYVAGLEGYLSENWTYEVSGVYGKTEIDRLNLNNRINDRWQAGMDVVRDANGNLACRVSVNPNAINPNTGRAYLDISRAGCVPFSVFGNGAVDPKAAAWFNYDAINRSKITQSVFSASVANSALFELPAGGVGFAGGIEYRKETSEEITDPLAAQGLTFLNAIPSRKGEYSVKEIFAEATVPLLADLPGVQRLSMDLAGRYSDYDTVGSTKTWNVGLDWAINDSLRLRGSVAQAVRAPNIGELFNPQTQNFATVYDPCDTRPGVTNGVSTAGDPALRASNCATLGIPANYRDTYTGNRPGVSGGNPDLNVEQARSLSYGLVWQPEFIEGFGLSVDYWRVTLTDAIGAVSAQTIATRCVDSPGGIGNDFCALIQRAPAAGYVDSQGRTFPANSIYSWKAINENLAKTRRAGVDIEADYRFEMLGGQAALRFVGTRLISSREWPFQDFPAEYDEYVTYVSDPRWRASLNASYKHGNWRGSWDMRYIDGNLRVVPESYNSNPGQISPIRNPSYTYHNLQIGYKVANTGLDLYIGADNVFDKDPPLNYFGETEDNANYDSIGRYVYAGATYKF